MLPYLHFLFISFTSKRCSSIIYNLILSPVTEMLLRLKCFIVPQVSEATFHLAKYVIHKQRYT